MKIADALRDRTALSALLDPADQRYVTGSPEDRKRARDEWHRHRYAAQVMRSDLEEIPRADLAPLRFGVVEDTRTGAFYRPGATDWSTWSTRTRSPTTSTPPVRRSSSSDRPGRRTGPSSKHGRPHVRSAGPHRSRAPRG